jgi:hypothetical protein
MHFEVLKIQVFTLTSPFIATRVRVVHQAKTALKGQRSIQHSHHIPALRTTAYRLNTVRDAQSSHTFGPFQMGKMSSHFRESRWKRTRHRQLSGGPRRAHADSAYSPRP